MNTVKRNLLFVLILGALSIAQNATTMPKSALSCAQIYYPYAVDAIASDQQAPNSTTEAAEPRAKPSMISDKPMPQRSQATSRNMIQGLGLEEKLEMPTRQNIVTAKLASFARSLKTSSMKKLAVLAAPIFAYTLKSMISDALKGEESLGKKLEVESVVKIAKQTFHNNSIARDLFALLFTKGISKLAKAGIEKLSHCA